ncbi:MAG TPA: arylamine N-acetyltransferase [Streptosporangiaceae bacterium]|nr:arylamine N-acetyltransferase [Streptosporangiaceae bacterium]
MDNATVDAYLERIGTKRPARLDLAALRELQERHILSIPFEMFDFNLKVPIALGEGAAHKFLDRNRGGGCYELNSSFATLLRALGFKVAIFGGRVLHNGRQAVHGALNGHMALCVEIDGTKWLSDVGFRWASRYPLRFDLRGEQDDPHGTYQIVYTHEGDAELVQDGVPRYRLETREREIDDFMPTLWWFIHAPDSPTADSRWASLVLPNGRISLLDRTLSHRENGVKIKEEYLADDDDFLRAMKTYLGIELDRVPELRTTH